MRVGIRTEAGRYFAESSGSQGKFARCERDMMDDRPTSEVRTGAVDESVEFFYISAPSTVMPRFSSSSAARCSATAIPHIWPT